ncbi:MAG: trypsin-like peptidase domain-containing protein [Patescibacteria group bacterium]
MRKLIILVVILIVLLGLLSISTSSLRDLSHLINPVQTVLPGSIDTVKIVSEESVVIAVSKDVAPSVVTIAGKFSQSPETSNQVNPFFFFGLPFQEEQPSRPGEPQNIGSGFIVTKDGLIVTNKHVVNDTSLKYSVTTNNGKTYSVQKIYRDPLNDIAIIQINPSDNAGNTLKPVRMGDSSRLQVGQLAIAIGTALGEFNNTVTTGVISGLGRGITAGSQLEGTVEELSDVIQTDAAINPGNSGGPLLNASGQVIGVNTAVSQSGQNIGFALPINKIKDSINNFNSTGQFNRPYLGVAYQVITRDMALRNDLPEGAYIQTVVAGSAADKAGIKVGDIIEKVDGEKLVAGKVELSTLIGRKKVGDSMTLVIYREDDSGTASTFEKKVILNSAPEQ